MEFLVEAPGLAFTVASAGVAGVWFCASQVASLKGLARRLDDFKTEAAARYTAHDVEIRQRDMSIAAVDSRLSRIEASLTFLVAGMTPVTRPPTHTPTPPAE